MVRVKIKFYRNGASAYLPIVPTKNCNVIVRYNEDREHNIDEVTIDPDYMEYGYDCIHVYPYYIRDEEDYLDYDELEHEQEIEEENQEFMEDVLNWFLPYLPRSLQKIIN